MYALYIPIYYIHTCTYICIHSVYSRMYYIDVLHVLPQDVLHRLHSTQEIQTNANKKTGEKTGWKKRLKETG